MKLPYLKIRANHEEKSTDTRHCSIKVGGVEQICQQERTLVNHLVARTGTNLTSGPTTMMIDKGNLNQTKVGNIMEKSTMSQFEKELALVKSRLPHDHPLNMIRVSNSNTTDKWGHTKNIV